MGQAAEESGDENGEDESAGAVAVLADTGKGAYYFIKSKDRDDVENEDSVLNLMLPFAAVDETVRTNGCYVVRYHKDSATVLDVFYWQETDNFSHEYNTTDYQVFLENRGNKEALKYYGTDGSVIGYYGTASGDILEYGKKITTPNIVVTNADTLSVTVTDYNKNNDVDKDNIYAQLKLIIKGETSKAITDITLVTVNNKDGKPIFTDKYDYKTDPETGTYIFDVVLDDITRTGWHFSNQFASAEFIPGENISIQAVSFNNNELTNIAYSPEYKTNSLFAYNGDEDEDAANPDKTAHISYIRHLENLETDISNVNLTDERLKYVNKKDDNITIKAKQINDITWESAKYEHVFGIFSEIISVTGSFVPVGPSNYALEYEGSGHSISNVVINVSKNASGFGDLGGNAGLFSKLDNNDKVVNLKLIGFKVTNEQGSAGALAGELKGASITNIIAYNTGKNFEEATEVTINGSENAGGLIGKVTSSTEADGSVTKCAASLIVKLSGGNAGGLIGTVNGVNINSCYSGGHTENGEYNQTSFNVTANKSAGGLIGEIIGTADKNVAIENCYSTCSAKGEIAGGLIGNVSYGNVTNCYSTGLVNGTLFGGAFIGAKNADSQLNSCVYYEIINEIEDVEEKGGTKKHKGYIYLEPVGNGKNVAGITYFDSFEKNADGKTPYELFIGKDLIDENGNINESNRSIAITYDRVLTKYYQGKYLLQTVKQLGGAVADGDFILTHYGDWPAPEILVVNEK